MPRAIELPKREKRPDRAAFIQTAPVQGKSQRNSRLARIHNSGGPRWLCFLYKPILNQVADRRKPKGSHYRPVIHVASFDAEIMSTPFTSRGATAICATDNSIILQMIGARHNSGVCSQRKRTRGYACPPHSVEEDCGPPDQALWIR